MKLLLLTLCFTSFAQSQTLISGYDDVLRQSNNTSLINVVRHFFKEDRSYTGMNRLYRTILGRTGQKRFHLLTATPSFFHSHVEDFLAAHEYPESELHLRNVFTSPLLKSYRLHSLKEVCPQKDCIWIADSSDGVLEVITELQDWKGQIYVRLTEKKDLPPAAAGFVTAFDLALLELRRGRLSRKDAEAILTDLLGEPDEGLLVPDYAYCPSDYNPCESGIFPLCERFRSRIQAICSKRSERMSE